MPVAAIARELTLEFSFAYRPCEFHASLDAIGADPERFEPLITSELPLAETARAFDELAREPNQIKVLIDPRR